MTHSTDEGLIDEQQAWRSFDQLSESLSPELTAAMREELRTYFGTHSLINRTTLLLMAIDRKDGLEYVGAL
ncbi:hypothetical protein H7J07_05620 [Mycobacterium koreense]|uniref:Uncharacterized protein n=1 Tax=Mycolicibacillus koreensis TaxID=1069220 RepID=A0A7I7SBC1_9MYCO|nr:hypothetical protein [Mycolicibacillus koreensis]MCV7247703.1 hypothetical protein [Mycolicibacillus koreensis]OSC34763.1 hypothetical protein B8W67_05815 [Mycolicibacillus koreensis]BBY54088.1 hypothetical protein MKOR_13390 [Mycolicibacillus koreensis]